MSELKELKELKDRIIDGLKSKKMLLDLAETFDAYRVIPRMLVASYGYLVYSTSIWFMTLADPTTQQVTFVSTVVGAAAVVIGLYTNSGRKWQ